jgi:hypothetical protein
MIRKGNKMKELKHYVYIYLDPRKPGKFEYFDQGIGISFDYEPFYIGEGKGNRIYQHLTESRDDNFENKIGNNKYKIRKIRKIWKHNLKPIIYKIFEFENEQDALNIERTLGFLIGRYNLNEGPLTNIIDCGGKTSRPTEECKARKKQKEMETKRKDPSIMKKAGIKCSETRMNDPEGRKESGRKLSERRRNESLEQKQKRKDNYKKTITENPSCRQRAVENTRKTKQNNPEIKIKEIESYKQTLKNDPSINIRRAEKCVKTRIINKTGFGKDHVLYIKLDYKFLLYLYFNKIPFPTMCKLYFDQIDNTITSNAFKKFYTILNFPKNTIAYNRNKETNRYLWFIEENKHKLQWYIDNYERLEEEYFERLYQEKYKEFLITNN